MTHYDMYQQNLQHNPQQWWSPNPQMTQPYGQPGGGFGMPGLGSGIGQAAYGQQPGQFGQPYGQQFGQSHLFGQPYGQQFGQLGGPWGQLGGLGGQPMSTFPQRQLSHQDVGEVVRQLVPLLPQVLAQAQQPLAAYGYSPYGPPRQLSQQDVNEVVRQILPIVPHIIGLLQAQPPMQSAMYGGAGGYGPQAWMGLGLGAQNPMSHFPIGQTPLQQQTFGQTAWPAFQAAFGGQPLWNQSQRQLTQQDVGEVVRQLVGLIPQVIGNLQAFGQQRPN